MTRLPTKKMIDRADMPEPKHDGYPCPKCHGTRTRATDSRPTENGRRRRRGCFDCNYRWTTLEVIVDELSAMTRRDEITDKITDVVSSLYDLIRLLREQPVLSRDDR